MAQQFQPQGRSAQQSQGIRPQQGQIGQQSQGQQGQIGQQGQQGQIGQQSQQGQQQQFQPTHFDEALPSEFRAALEDLSWLRKQTKWASERAHVTLQGTGIETTLEDVSEIAELNEELILSGSKFVQHEIDTFRRIATEAIQDLQQYQQEPFVEAVVSDLTRAIHSADELLASYGGATQQTGGQSQMQGQQGGQNVGSGGQQSPVGQQSQVGQQGQSQVPTQSQPYSQY